DLCHRQVQARLSIQFAYLGQVPEAPAWHALVQWLFEIPECRPASQPRHIEVTQQHPEDLPIIGSEGPSVQLEILVGTPELGKVVDGINTSLRIHVQGIEYGLQDFLAHRLVSGQAVLRGRELFLLDGLIVQGAWGAETLKDLQQDGFGQWEDAHGACPWCR